MDANSPVSPANKTVIVGIGSSAGGVEALRALFAHLPSDTGLGFVLVSHTARSHVSVLPDILSRCTDMPVSIAEHGQPIQPNHVYVGPSDHVLSLQGRMIQLNPRSSARQHNPIDVFLSSLAKDLGEDSIGVVLSGAGSDGTLGLKAIKECGGLTIVQGADGSAPQHPSMPNTAIATGVVDVVLPVEQIGERLQQLARTLSLLTQDGDIDLPEVEEEIAEPQFATAARFEPIYRVLVNQLAHDFSGYKVRTFARRVRRRMQVVQLATLDEYIDLLTSSAEEVQLLFRDLLIGVTNFFRDADAFQQLQTLVIPKLLDPASHPQSRMLRIWVPGCATGEEVYSIAILVQEYIDTLTEKPRVQIFATDIDERALAVARGARYPSTLLRDNVSEERLQRFFTLDDVSYVVNREIRELCIFSSHSVIRDPPFSRVDLISCRNLLIYLGTQFQAQVVPVFHFALRPHGYLFLGTSENVSQHSDLFTPLDKRQRIFQRRDHVQAPLQLPFLTATRRAMSDVPDLARSPRDSHTLRRQIEQRVIDRYAPVHVVVDASGNILHYSARTGRYLEPAAGVPSRQLSTMARRGLRLELQNALRQAIRIRAAVTRKNVPVELGESTECADILIEPYGERGGEALYLVVFNESSRSASSSEELPDKDKVAESDAVERLDLELREIRDRLQSTIEEHETAVEELKSANEELQSINEELQSSNEELETSREELQSVNEELQTVNHEMNAKVEELDRANSDLHNLFESTQIATVFLDRNLIIRSFTPAVRVMFNLIATDRGRPLTDFVSNLEDADLAGAVAEVMQTGTDVERQVQLKGGSRHYLMRVLPYRDGHAVIQGVVVTFVDVTSALETEIQQRTLVEELNHRVRNMLTVVNAMASQTIERAPSLEAFAAAFSGRIKAMAAAYSLVSRKSWGDVELKDLLTKQLQIYGSDVKSVTVTGPAVLLRPNAALSLGMVFHELTTNAIKYGALSLPTGSLEVSWSITEGPPPTVDLLWRENGRQNKPDTVRRGFGTELIERQLAHVLDAQLQTQHLPTGLEVRMRIPVDPTRLSVDGDADSGGEAECAKS